MISRRHALAAGLALTLPTRGFAADRALGTLVAGPQRSAANVARDRWRHPLESLSFWGLKPQQTVLEIDPFGGYWTEVLAPYLAQGGGRYVVGLPDPGDPKLSEPMRKARATFLTKYADRAVYGPIDTVDFSSTSGLVAPAASFDLILITRNIHNLTKVRGLDRALAGFSAALRPGALLGVEEHRADPRRTAPDGIDGYVSEKLVIEAAAKAGLTLDGRSEINANPKDGKDHPFGVWTLPPTRRSAPEGHAPDLTFDHTPYDAIGESDRMTLRFRKSGARTDNWYSCRAMVAAFHPNIHPNRRQR